MPTLSARALALLSALAAAAALGVALGSQRWDDLVPCALCLLERWPYRAAIVVSLAAVLMPPRWARATLGLVVLIMLASVALAFVHVGVEAHWWPSPLPECAAPHFVAGTIAQRLASMPLRPSKPCDAPTYLIPGLNLSMAAMNLIFAAVFAVVLGAFIGRGTRRRA